MPAAQRQVEPRPRRPRRCKCGGLFGSGGFEVSCAAAREMFGRRRGGAEPPRASGCIEALVRINLFARGGTDERISMACGPP